MFQGMVKANSCTVATLALFTLCLAAAAELAATRPEQPGTPPQHGRLRIIWVRAQFDEMRVWIDGVDRWMNRGVFVDLLQRAEYPFSVNAFSDVGIALTNMKAYRLVCVMPDGGPMNETHIKVIEPIAGDAEAAGPVGARPAGQTLSAILSQWGDPDRAERAGEQQSTADAKAVCALIYVQRGKRVLINQRGSVVGIENMEAATQPSTQRAP